MGGIQLAPSWDAQSWEKVEDALTPVVGLGPSPHPTHCPPQPQQVPECSQAWGKGPGGRSSSAGGRRGLGVGLC